METQVLALERSVRGGDRAAARRAWTAAYERYLRIGAAYGALGDLDAAIVGDRERLERGLWTGERLSALRPAAARLEARRAHAAPHRPAGRDHPAGLRDPRARDPRGRPARHAQRRRRALQRGGRAWPRRHRWRRPRRWSARCGRCSPSAARSRPIDSGLVRLRARARRDPARPRRRMAGARRALPPTERQRLNGRLGAGLEHARPAAARARDARSRPRSRRAAAVKVNRRRFLAGSAPDRSSPSPAGETVAPHAPRGARDRAGSSASRSTARTRPAC